MERNTYNEVADHYARYLQELDREDFSFNHDLVIPRLLAVAGEVAGLTVLDAGCGEGIVARLLAERGAQVTGIDISPRLIELAQAQDTAHTIPYLVHDLSHPLPAYEDHFDLVVSNLVLNDVPDYRGFINTLGSVTKPRGRAVVSINNPYSALIREKVESYFDSGQATMYNMAKEGVAVYYFHRTLEEYITAFHHARFLLRTLIDLQLPDDVAANLPDRYRSVPYHSWYARFPFFLILEFIKQEA